MKNKGVYKARVVVTVIGILAFAAIIIWFIIGLDKAQGLSDEQRRINVKQSVMNGAVLCYSVEGFYPESIDYLKENYGLTYDENRYSVQYTRTSADRRPTVLVFEKNGISEGAA